MGGILANNGGVEGLMNDPYLNVGLSLLQANNAGPGQDNNPFSAVQRGMQNTQRNRDLTADRRAVEQARNRQDELYKRLQELYGGASPGGLPAPMTGGMSPVMNAPQSIAAMQGLPGAAGGMVPGATPGINPAAAPPPFTSAPGSNAAPGANEIAALMLQYGDPSQQAAAMSQMSAREQFNTRLAAEEARWQQTQLPQNRIGTYNPRDYTAESWAEFTQSGDPSKLKRYERVSTVDVGGIKYAIDTATGENLGAVTGLDEATNNTRALSSSQSVGTAQGTAIGDAQVQLASMNQTQSQFERLLNDPRFDSAVGMIDAPLGRLGEQFGTEAGVLGGEIERASNALVTQAVSNWKGAISERELDFFQRSVPQRGSSAATWRHWYENEYKPLKARVESLATGAAFEPYNGPLSQAPIIPNSQQYTPQGPRGGRNNPNGGNRQPAPAASGTINGVQWELVQ